MQSPNIYCCFCGVVIQTDNFEEPESLEIRRPWYSEARAICPSDGISDEVRLTGVGVMRSRSVLHAPRKPDATYQETDDLEPVLLFQDSQASWGFGFHDACWKIFLLRLAVSDCDQYDIIRCLFIQFLNSPCPGHSCLDLGHDYSGAASTHKSWGLPRPVDLLSPFYADPCDIPSLEMVDSTTPPEFVARLVNKPAHVAGHRLKPISPAFGKLSVELVYEILSYLPYARLAQLRLVCRDLAWKARPDQLPQSYWKSRFCLGQELAFMCPNLSTVTRDWFRAYWGTTSLLITGHLSLTNRKRIWGLLDPIAALVEFHFPLRRKKDGYVLSSSENGFEYHASSTGNASEDATGAIRLAQSFSGQISQTAERHPLESGCHMFEVRAAAFHPSDFQEGGQLKISGLRLGARKVISGFRCWRKGTQDYEHRLGLCDTPIQWIVKVPSKSSLQSIDVVFCSVGLVGIRFVYKDGGSSEWVGQSQGEGVAHGRLHLPNDAGQCFLLAGLDDLKIVKVGLGTPSEPLLANPVKIEDAHYISVHSQLWTPNIPEQENVKITRLIPTINQGPFEPLVNIDFGGANGLLLQTLSRVVVHMLSHTHPISRIEFHYSDGVVRSFGTGPLAAELSFCIDGSRGERITRIGVSQKPLDLTLAGLEIITNRGRTANFASLSQRNGVNNVHHFPVYPGHAITGLVGSIEDFKHTFSKIGIQSQPAIERHSRDIDQKNSGFLVPTEADLIYDLEFAETLIRTKGFGEYETYAPLRNVRSIQASVGVSGRSRYSRRISGLKFDFYDHRNPSIVGQWMKDSDKFIVNLARHEIIQTLTIWITKDAVSGEYPTMRHGQVAAIRIVTDRGQNVTFCPSIDTNFLNTCLKTQYQADPYQELAAVSWVLNSRFDRVRAIFSPKAAEHIFAIQPELYAAFRQIQKLPFELILDDGCYDKLIKVVGHIDASAFRGFTFAYKSGQTWIIGDNHSDEIQSFEIPESDRIVGLSLRTAKGIKEISFGIEHWREDDMLLSRCVKLAVSQPIQQDTFVDRGILNIWSKDEESANAIANVAQANALFTPPIGTRLAGIYVPCQNFAELGCFYERIA